MIIVLLIQIILLKFNQQLNQLFIFIIHYFITTIKIIVIIYLDFYFITIFLTIFIVNLIRVNLIRVKLIINLIIKYFNILDIEEFPLIINFLLMNNMVLDIINIIKDNFYNSFKEILHHFSLKCFLFPIIISFIITQFIIYQ